LGGTVDRGFLPPAFSDSGNDATATRLYRGTLLPGAYSLFVEASGVGFFFHQGGAGTAHGAFNFTLDMTPVQQTRRRHSGAIVVTAPWHGRAGHSPHVQSARVMCAEQNAR